ncbi:MAG: hypothetical protein JWM87_717 [Candidatus Eremiobacteraeota bacterium]|nr:hypothetical protein [Candidatus Eremiobacteraeota bacterium]
MSEASIRAAHRFTGADQASGHATVCYCSCGARWYDSLLDCPALEAALDELHLARINDDGAPHASFDRTAS